MKEEGGRRKESGRSVGRLIGLIGLIGVIRKVAIKINKNQGFYRYL